MRAHVKQLGVSLIRVVTLYKILRALTFPYLSRTDSPRLENLRRA